MKTRQAILALALCAALPSAAQGVEEPDTIVSNNGWELPGGTLQQPHEQKKDWRPVTEEPVEKGPASRRRSVTSRATERGSEWNSVSVSYMRYNLSHLALEVMDGFSVGYKYGTRISKAPWFVEAGVFLSAAWGKNDHAANGWYPETAKFRMGAVESRGDILYRWQPGHGKLALEPWVGFSLVGFVYGTQKTDMGEDIDNIFSDDVEYHFERGLFRLSGGMNVCYDDLFLGVSYSFDVNEFQRDFGCRSRILEATLGVRF